jgi:hypothetical protein
MSRFLRIDRARQSHGTSLEWGDLDDGGMFLGVFRHG